MKNIILIIAFLFVAFSVNADWLETEMIFQAGWIPFGALLYYTPDSAWFCGGIYNNFDATFKIDAHVFDFFLIGGNAINNFSFNSSDKGVSLVNFTPTGITYSIYLGIEFIKGLSIKYEHSCSHPIAAYFPSFPNGDYAIDSGFDRVYLEIKGSFSF